MTATPEHKNCTNWILAQVHSVTGKYNGNANMQRLYHSAFLASYLANILRTDIAQRRAFERHIQRLKQR